MPVRRSTNWAIFPPVCLVFFPLLPCLAKWFWAKPDEQETFPYHCGLRLFTMARKSLCGPIHHHHHHHSLSCEGHWGTTDIFATSFLHFPLFSTALWDLPNSRPVHSLMLSSHLFLCLPCLLPPYAVPCKMVFARPDERETWSDCCLYSSSKLCCEGPWFISIQRDSFDVENMQNISIRWLRRIVISVIVCNTSTFFFFFFFATNINSFMTQPYWFTLY